MKRVFHVLDDLEREVDPAAVNYGDEVMVRYLDNDEVAIIKKSELKVREG